MSSLKNTIKNLWTYVYDSQFRRVHAQRLKKKASNITFEKIYSIENYKKPFVCTSQLCNQDFFGLPLFQYWARAIKEELKFHRKLWEFVYIIQALYENGCLQEGKNGLGFGVGTEPLPALFASLGCEILATDLNANDAKEKGWIDSKQHANTNPERLNHKGICPQDIFNKKLRYRYLDMNQIPNDLTDFDFNWSACALEHIGGLEKSCNFIINNLETLKPGGIAVHTTEFNFSSNDETLLDPNCTILREQDIKKTIERLSSLGHYVYPLDLRRGTLVTDNFIDAPPYKLDVHLRLKLDKYITTSIGLIIRKKS